MTLPRALALCALSPKTKLQPVADSSVRNANPGPEGNRARLRERLVRWLSWSGPAIASGAWMTRVGFPLPQVATADLDISIVGQPPAANLPLGNEFERGPVQVETFKAPFRRWGVRKQDLEDAPGNTHHTLIIFSDPYTEPDDGALGLALANCVVAVSPTSCGLTPAIVGDQYRASIWPTTGSFTRA
jgi:hypothetical protein